MRRKSTNPDELVVKERLALGYIRVSTEEQAANGHGLEKQEARIRAEADARGFTQVIIYQDVGSAVGSRSIHRREELQDVLRRAKRERLPIIVSKLDRLTREPEALNGILSLDGVEIISCDPRDMSSKKLLKQRAEKAKQTAINISIGKKRSQAEKKARGEKVGHPETLDAGRLESARVRKEKAAEVIDRMAIFIDGTPGLAEKTAAEIADALNIAGIKTSRSFPWTVDNIRPKLRPALKQIRENQEIADELGDVPSHEEVFGTAPNATDKGSDVVSRSKSLGSRSGAADARATEDEPLDYNARMRRTNPNWGRF